MLREIEILISALSCCFAKQFETADIQQARLIVRRNINTSAKQLETADIQQACLIVKRNRNNSAKQLETADIQQALFDC